MKYIVALLFVAFFVGGIFFAVALSNNPPYRYVGEMTFDTEEDYMNFKKYVTEDRVEIVDIDVLASAPPIWVSYNLITPDKVELFPFDYNSTGGSPSTLSVLGVSCLIAIGLFGFLITSVIL